MRHIWCPLLTAKGAAKLKKYLRRSRRGAYKWGIFTAEMTIKTSEHFFDKYWKRNFEDPQKLKIKMKCRAMAESDARANQKHVIFLYGLNRVLHNDKL